MPFDLSGLNDVDLSGWSEDDSKKVLAKFAGLPDAKVLEIRKALHEVAEAQVMGQAVVSNIVSLASFAKLILAV